MPDKLSFEYAVIRIVPMVEREEFINIGVILYCPAKKYLSVLLDVNEKRLKTFSNNLDIDELQKYLQSFQRICNGEKNAGPVGKLSPAERFRWLTATRSTIVQLSKVHPGICADAAATLQKLFEQMVLIAD